MQATSRLPRLLPDEAVQRYVRRPTDIPVVHYDPEIHEEEMKAVAVGVIGALLKMDKVDSVSGPQVGSRIPIVALKVPGDVIRIYIDPYMEAYGRPVRTGMAHIKKAQEHVELTALTYGGDGLLVDTAEMSYTNHRGLAVELQFQDRILAALPREIPL